MRCYTGLLCLLAVLPAAAQTNPAVIPPVQDPMMSLMLAQPRMEFNVPVVAEVAFDPPAVRPRELAVYRVSFNALEDSIKWPTNVPSPNGLKMQPGGHGQILQMAGTNMQPRTTFNYRVTAEKTGVFTIPERTVEVYGKPVRVPAAQLLVAPDRPSGAPAAQQLYLELPGADHFYVGQAIRARVLSPAGPGNQIQGITQVQFMGQGFITDQSAVRQMVQVIPRADVPGGGIQTLIYETTITPLQAGRLDVFVQAFTAGNRFGGTIVITGPAVIPGGQPQYTLVDSVPRTLNVRPLPIQGKLPGFTGAIGKFMLDPIPAPTNVLRAGDPFQLPVTIRGQGNLSRLVPPPPPASRDWQVFPGQSSAAPQSVQIIGYVTLPFTFIPLSDEVTDTPAIPFSYFDPDRGAYQDLTIPPVAVVVEAGEVPVNKALLQQARTATASTNKEPVLSGLAAMPGTGSATLVPLQQRAWFPAVQLAPAAALLGLLFWDRRRRFLEAHPDLVRRRKARRALRRQRRVVQAAAHDADSRGFAEAAVRAFRVACAPHYPAEPRALVSADVLPLIDEPLRSGEPGCAVQRLFAATDAAQYSTTGNGISELLPLKASLEQALDHLEQKLEG